MDIFTTIRNDHDLARQLMQRLTAARSPELRQHLCEELRQAVRVHSRAEEATFYAALRDCPAYEDGMTHSTAEHEAIDERLDEAVKAGSTSPWFLPLYGEARLLLERHMTEEEDLIFPLAKKLLTEIHAQRLGRDMRQLKDDYIEADFMSCATLRADAGWYA